MDHGSSSKPDSSPPPLEGEEDTAAASATAAALPPVAPPATAPRYPSQPVGLARKRNTYVPYGVIGMAIFFMLRTMSSMNSSSSIAHLPKLPNLDSNLYKPIYIPPVDLGTLGVRPPPAMPKPLAGSETHGELVDQILASTLILQRVDVGTSFQAIAAANFDAAVLAGDCPAMLAQLPDLAGPDGPVTTEENIYASAHIEAVRARAHKLCDGVTPATTPPKPRHAK